MDHYWTRTTGPKLKKTNNSRVGRWDPQPVTMDKLSAVELNLEEMRRNVQNERSYHHLKVMGDRHGLCLDLVSISPFPKQGPPTSYAQRQTVQRCLPPNWRARRTGPTLIEGEWHFCWLMAPCPGRVCFFIGGMHVFAPDAYAKIGSARLLVSPGFLGPMHALAAESQETRPPAPIGWSSQPRRLT